MNTAEVIDRYYALANAGEWDAWSDLFAVDQTMDEQLAGHVEGRETLREMMRGFPRTWAFFANMPVHIVIDGDRAAVLSHISGRTAGGESVEADVCNYFEITDGLISYMQNVHDSVPFAPILGK
ncbi:nuclear transport factor 2 family protein [Streptomyces sp. 8L]|uniref:nuclear transport factor 2 family protein n=1 Tax=unclassified Streptomyces TaxID=2593676 RepID=UPI001CD504E6|nr:nuclear transport factor 2 family protein [Streptomyces sp. 8L]MCA1216892.1 nuclear transport factor 2 family protein [Streptomyces sp. 8L]